MIRPYSRANELESLGVGPRFGAFEVPQGILMCSRDSETYRVGETQELQANPTDLSI